MENYIWEDRKHWMWFPWSFTRYKLSETRIFIETGFIKNQFDETQLYRVTDIRLTRSLGQRIFGTGTIFLSTRDGSNPVIELKNVKKSPDVKEMIAQLVEEARKRNFVRTIDSGISNYSDNDGDGIPDIFQDMK